MNRHAPEAVVYFLEKIKLGDPGHFKLLRSLVKCAEGTELRNELANSTAALVATTFDAKFTVANPALATQTRLQEAQLRFQGIVLVHTLVKRMPAWLPNQPDVLRKLTAPQLHMLSLVRAILAEPDILIVDDFELDAANAAIEASPRAPACSTVASRTPLQLNRCVGSSRRFIRRSRRCFVSGWAHAKPSLLPGSPLSDGDGRILPASAPAARPMLMCAGVARDVSARQC